MGTVRGVTLHNCFYTSSKCSIGYKSGDLQAQYLRRMFSFLRKSSTLWVLCGFALSSIKMKYRLTALRNNLTLASMTSSLRSYASRVPALKTSNAIQLPNIMQQYRKIILPPYLSILLSSWDDREVYVLSRSRLDENHSTWRNSILCWNEHVHSCWYKTNDFISTRTGISYWVKWNGHTHWTANIRRNNRFNDKVTLLWDGIILGSCTPLRVFDAATVNAYRYMYEVLETHGRLFRVAVSPAFMFMDDYSKQHRAQIVDIFSEESIIRRMNCPSWFLDLHPIE